MRLRGRGFRAKQNDPIREELITVCIDPSVVTHADLNHLRGLPGLIDRKPGQILHFSHHGGSPGAAVHVVPPPARRVKTRHLEAAARFLPRAVRAERLDEWVDHLECEREEGGSPRRVMWSILLRAVVPTVIACRFPLLTGATR